MTSSMSSSWPRAASQPRRSPAGAVSAASAAAVTQAFDPADRHQLVQHPGHKPDLVMARPDQGQLGGRQRRLGLPQRPQQRRGDPPIADRATLVDQHAAFHRGPLPQAGPQLQGLAVVGQRRKPRPGDGVLAGDVQQAKDFGKPPAGIQAGQVPGTVETRRRGRQAQRLQRPRHLGLFSTPVGVTTRPVAVHRARRTRSCSRRARRASAASARTCGVAAARAGAEAGALRCSGSLASCLLSAPRSSRRGRSSSYSAGCGPTPATQRAKRVPAGAGSTASTTMRYCQHAPRS